MTISSVIIERVPILVQFSKLDIDPRMWCHFLTCLNAGRDYIDPACDNALKRELASIVRAVE